MSGSAQPGPPSSARPGQVPPIVAAAAAAAALYGWAIVATTPFCPGAIGVNINALGNEWMVFYGAVQWFLHGHLAALYDGNRFTAYLNAAFAPLLSQPMSLRPFVYPPSYLLLVLPFGLLPFTLSWLLFETATAGLLAAALWLGGGERRGIRLFVLCGALLGPAAAINFGGGENAFLSAGLLIGGLRLVRHGRPEAGGLLLGLLTVKPQFAMLAPVALVALRDWRALWWYAAAAVGLVAASAAVFGVALWQHWLGLALGGYWQANAAWVEAARVWGTSVYAALFASGVPSSLANLGQAGATIGAAGLAYAAYRRPLPADRQIAVLLAATMLAAPHSSVVDLVILSAAVMLWCVEAVREETALAKWTLALALWLAILFNPPLASPPGRLTPLLILGFIALAMSGHREAAEAAEPLAAAR
ncbi:MAG TPA: glycosyltransferase family 87 protein [Stellaceae bacterium]|nr:glycosyltransferase family 87 protein [Stellaceae bacterium]